MIHAKSLLFLTITGVAPLRLRAQAVHVRDSAGIQITESARPGWTAAQVLRLGASPTLVIGTRTEETYQLSKVAGAVRLGDGRIVIGDGSTSQLRFFDAQGTFLTSVGRRGDGPGEFQGLSRIYLIVPDTLVAGSPSRLSVFSTSGRFTRRVDPLVPPAPLPIGERTIIAVFAGGKSILGSIAHPVESHHGPQTASRWTDSLQLAFVAGGNVLVHSLGSFPARVLEWQGVDLLNPVWAPQALIATGSGECFLGFGSDYSIRVYSSSGRLERIIRRSWKPQPMDIEDWATLWVKTAGPMTQADAAAKRKELRGVPHTVALPAFGQLVADRTGRLWVRESRLVDYVPNGMLSDVSSRWSVFAKGGEWLGEVSMPARFRPTDIGPDYVLGVAQDEDGLETVVMYRLAAN